MKFKFLSFLCLMLLAEMIYAQKLFSGKIVYEVIMEGDVSPIVASAVPEKIVVTIRNGIVREDIMGQTMIFDGHQKTLTAFIEGGKRAAIVQSLKSVLSKEKISDVTILEAQETKNIAGFLCRKAVASYLIEGKEIVQSFYYTSEIQIGEAYQLRAVFREIAGFPLEYEMYMQGVRLLFKAVEVKEGKVDKHIFEIPKGFEVIPVE